MPDTSYEISDKHEPRVKKRMRILFFSLALIIIGFGVSSVILIKSSLNAFQNEFSLDDIEILEKAEKIQEEILDEEAAALIVSKMSTDFQEEAYVLYVKGDQAVCQPAEFNLDENLYYVSGGEKSSLETENFGKVEVLVDSDLDYIALKEPYLLVPTAFSCSEEKSFILDVRKPGKDGVNALLPGNRQRSFTHVTNWATSDFNKLYVSNSELNAVEDWEKSRRIYSPATDTAIDLPAIGCVDEFGVWDKEKLITYAETETTTEFCVWSDFGDLLYRFEYDAEWKSGDTKDKFGYASHDENLFYVLTKRNSENCKAHVFDLEDYDHFKVVNVKNEEDSQCSEVELNLDVLSLID